jgi:choline-sulfatase
MAKDRLNIILIGMDDAFSYWRFRTAFGAELKLPNLDRICEVSSAFHAAYCQIPVCGPSRSSAMSGLSPYETGIFDNYTNIFEVLRPEQMWQYRLKEDGYYCSTAGKIHHGYKPLPPEVHDVLYSHPARHVFFGPKRSAPYEFFGGRTGGAGTTDPKDDRLYYDARSSRDAIRFLKSYDGDAPFYREVGFHHPHPPFRTPIRFKQMYDIADFVRPNAWSQGFDLAEFTQDFMLENMETDENIEYWQQSVRNYFSAFSHVDSHIGRVWDTLKASRFADNTILAVFSDHGYHMGDKNRFRKFTLWEEATRVPFIVHDPRQPGRVIEDAVALADLGPTLLDYAGVEPMQHAVGRSVRPLVEGETPAPRAIPTFWYGSASIREGDYRITLYQNGEAEFQNVAEDPWLTRNLAGNHPDYDRMRDLLIETCRAWGVLIVEQGQTAKEAAHFHSLLQGAAAPDGLPTDGIISVGDAPAAVAGPGQRKHFATLQENGTVAVSPGVREILFASDPSGGITHFKVACNAEGNRVYFFAGHRRFVLEVVGGDGGDRIITQNDSLIAHLGPGANYVFSGASDGTVHGGAGEDTILAVGGNNLIHGGSGSATIYGGTGNDTIHSGSAGANVIYTGAGENRIVLEGGRNRVIVDAADAVNMLMIQRTALPQIVDRCLRSPWRGLLAASCGPCRGSCRTGCAGSAGSACPACRSRRAARSPDSACSSPASRRGASTSPRSPAGAS